MTPEHENAKLESTYRADIPARELRGGPTPDYHIHAARNAFQRRLARRGERGTRKHPDKSDGVDARTVKL